METSQGVREGWAVSESVVLLDPAGTKVGFLSALLGLLSAGRSPLYVRMFTQVLSFSSHVRGCWLGQAGLELALSLA